MFRNVRIPALLAALALPAVAGPAAAQAGGFTAGDLYLYSPAVTGASSADGGLVRIDPLTGTAVQIADFSATPQYAGSAVWDPYRQRILFCAAFNGDPLRMWLSDAVGNLQEVGYVGTTYTNMAATGDGRVYMRREGTITEPFQWLDAANVLHPLLDETGSGPFLMPGVPGFPFEGFIYDAGENALFLAARGALTNCSGNNAFDVSVWKVPLSADGTRGLGSQVTCNEFNVEAGLSDERPVDWSRGPGGQLMLVIDTNSSTDLPRMLLVDPATLAITVWASSGYFGAGATSAGVYSTARAQAVILDTFSDVLRAYSQGGSGEGTIITPSIQISSGGGSGETATMMNIDFGGCAGAFVPYGAGLSGAGGFVPTLTGSGCPTLNGAIALHVDDAVGGAFGLMFVGLSPDDLPFLGGSLLVFPILLELPVAVGGGTGTPGAGSLTLPAVIPNDPLYAGLSIYLQAGFNDAGAVAGASLSQGLRMEIF